MDLNKAMVEMYKNHKSINENSINKKRPKTEDAITTLDYRPETTFNQLYGCEPARVQIIKIMDQFKRFIKGSTNKSHWPILICGSHGLGKTSIVEAAANYANMRLVPISLKSLVEQTRNEFKVTLKLIQNYCISIQPSVVLVDDLDQLNDKEDYRYLIRSTVKHLTDGDHQIQIFCTTSSILDCMSDLDFLFTIHLKRPSLDSRHQILRSLREMNKQFTLLTDDCLKQLAVNSPSFTAVHLRKMFDIAEIESDGSPTVTHCDKAINMIKQSFRRGTHLIGEKPSVTWDDIGGLSEVRRAFFDILKQIKKGDINCKFAGIALYGPPGCGKTMVAQAMANEVGLNFISIKPAELVDKFLGETEKNIRRVFSEAQEHEPCMIYFDEFDGLCGTRGHKDNVTSAIQTLLSEIDGFVGRGKSIILASTNRLEDIDPAMKRPGRLSKHIYVGPPNEKARKDILTVITNRDPLIIGNDVDLEEWARKTENFTGADLDFLVSEAESRAISELDLSNDSDFLEKVNLKREHFEYAIDIIKTTNKELSKKIR